MKFWTAQGAFNKGVNKLKRKVRRKNKLAKRNFNTRVWRG